MSISFLAFILLSVTIGFLVIDDFTKYILLKGAFTWIVAIGATKIYKKVKNIKSDTNTKNKYYKIKKQE